jgi:Glycosyltransferase 61
MVILFLFFFSCCFGLEPTKHTEMPLPFSYLENLYFRYPTHFIALSEDSQPIKNPVHYMDKTTLVLIEYDQNYFFHFFHLLEHLVGIWAFYGCEHADDVKRIVLVRDFSQPNKNWVGPNQINQHVISALFPHAQVLTWEEFIRERPFALYCLEKAVISDRGISAFDPTCKRFNKHLGVALRSIDPEKMQSFADRVHAYAKTEPKSASQLHVTYVKRLPPRCLMESIERSLLEKISALPDVALQAVDFAQMSFCEQIRTVAQTDVLIGVHGNGLSHILFLPSGACVIELFPENFHLYDYRFFAEARGIDYYGILYRSAEFLERARAYEIGTYSTVNKPIDALDIDLVLSAIRSRRSLR